MSNIPAKTAKKSAPKPAVCPKGHKLEEQDGVYVCTKCSPRYYRHMPRQ